MTTTEPLTVTQLTLAIKNDLETQFSGVLVTGEITGFRPHHQSGHAYFTIKDAGAVMPAVMWRSIVLRHKFDVRDGMEVVIRGKLTVYPPHGKYQLDVEKLEPMGIGARELALRQLKEKLFAKGYFDPRRKKRLPAYPRRLALITSPSGAAVRDMLQVLAVRWPHAEVLIVPARVQGDGAAEEMAQALDRLNQLHASKLLRIDVAVVGRGGGSAEDLWAFNEEILADAIFASAIPIVSAVGHEIDVSISDLVADLHALTPTDAANKIVPSRPDLLQLLRDLRNRLEEGVQHRLAMARQRLEACARHRIFRQPLEKIRQHEEMLDDLSGRLQRVLTMKLERAREALSSKAAQLESLSPLNVLGRGYSLTMNDTTGELLRDATLMQPGDRVTTRLARGSLGCRVEEITDTTASA